MAIKSGIFNSVNGDRKYNAHDFASYFASFIGNGVFPNPSNSLQIIAGTNMTTVVKAGKGWINGYFVVNDSDYVLQHDIADGVLKRIDRVVMRLNYLTRQIEIDVKKGTSASNPVAPTLQRDTDFVELALADVLINNGATVITQASITDTRLNNSLCGIVHGTVDQVDTTTLFNQYQSWIAQQKAVYEADLSTWTDEQKQEFETWQSLQEADLATWKQSAEVSFNDWMTQEQQDFETWFATLQDLLDENVAATLTAKVQDLENNKANSEDLTQLQQQVTTHLDENASLTAKGHVQLSSATDSDDETKAATPKAVKLAHEKAEQAFTQVSDGKNLIATAITDKGGIASGSDTFAVLASAIGGIETGAKIAIGEVSRTGSSTNYILDINGLSFTPKIVFGQGLSSNANAASFAFSSDGTLVNRFTNAASQVTDFTVTYKSDGVVASGFSSASSYGSYKFIAIG